MELLGKKPKVAKKLKKTWSQKKICSRIRIFLLFSEFLELFPPENQKLQKKPVKFAKLANFCKYCKDYFSSLVNHSRTHFTSISD